MAELKTNVLYYGDNLDILRKYIPDESVDLIYLDPPFNSKKDYNILFKETSGLESEAQIHAFTDTWHWTQSAQDTYQELIVKAPAKVAKLIDSLHSAIGQNDVMAYLVMMTIRLLEMHRVLKPTGSLYLHCDPSASHYLKIVLDQIFGPTNFKNEIVWKRFNFHADAKRFGRVTDRLLFYTKSDSFTFNRLKVAFSDDYVEAKFTHDDGDGRKYRLSDLNPPGGRGPVYEFNGITQPWRVTQEKMLALEAQGRIYTGSKIAQLKRYLDELTGQAVHDIWTDITLNAQAKERLGYDTQKPSALLERIIQASSNEGDIVLDPFCGCGTALVAAQNLNRKWIGIDITHLAIAVMKSRLEDSFPGIKVDVIGEPEDLAGAKALARQDRYQFQWWALSKIKAKPFPEERGKGADKGIDGVIDFTDRDEDSGKQVMKRAVVSVKSGHVHVRDIRELKDIASNNAMGVFITLEPPTREMKTEAVSAGKYHSVLWDKDYPKIQLLTIEELLQGKGVDMPTATSPYAKAPKVAKKGKQLRLEGG